MTAGTTVVPAKLTKQDPRIQHSIHARSDVLAQHGGQGAPDCVVRRTLHCGRCLPVRIAHHEAPWLQDVERDLSQKRCKE